MDGALTRRARNEDTGTELTDLERKELYELFKLVDADSNGSIDASDMHMLMSMLSMSTDEAEASSIVSAVDVNRSNSIECVVEAYENISKRSFLVILITAMLLCYLHQLQRARRGYQRCLRHPAEPETPHARLPHLPRQRRSLWLHPQIHS